MRQTDADFENKVIENILRKGVWTRTEFVSDTHGSLFSM